MMYPTAQERRYVDAVGRLAEGIQEAVNDRAERILRVYRNNYDTTNLEFEGFDPDIAEDNIDDPEFRRAFQEIEVEMEHELDDDRIRQLVVANMGGVASAVNSQFDMEFERMTTIQPMRREDAIRELMDQRIEENVDLIKTLPNRHNERIQNRVEQALTEGWSTQRLADQIPRDGATARFDAERIARDQVGKATSELTKQRHEDAGIETYIWSTAGDVRVRGEDPDDQMNHADLDGHRFSWDEGSPTSPGGGEDYNGDHTDGFSETGFPGMDIQCRCTAEFPDEELEDITQEAA